MPGGLRRGERLICHRCVEEAGDSTGTSALSADDLAEADQLGELTSEQEYDEALAAEIEWHLLADGTLDRGP